MDYMNELVQKLFIWCVSFARHVLYYHVIPEMLDEYIYRPIMQWEWLAPETVVDGEPLPGGQSTSTVTDAGAA